MDIDCAAMRLAIVPVANNYQTQIKWTPIKAPKLVERARRQNMLVKSVFFPPRYCYRNSAAA